LISGEKVKRNRGGGGGRGLRLWGKNDALSQRGKFLEGRKGGGLFRLFGGKGGGRVKCPLYEKIKQGKKKYAHRSSSNRQE